MKSNILIPTDFSIGSLNLVKQAMTQNTSSEITIVFACGVLLSDSITELLFFSPSEVLKNRVSSDFTEACNIIKNKYQSRILDIKTEIFTGTSQAAFNNFLEAHQIDETYVSQQYKMKPFHKRNFDCTPYLLRSPIKINKVGWEERPNLPEKDLLAELFLA